MKPTQTKGEALRLVVGMARQFVRTADRVTSVDPGPSGEEWQRTVGESLHDLEEMIELYSKVSEETDEARLRELLDEFRDRRAQIRWAQRRLGLPVNGRWSLRSRATCVVFQTRHCLAPTGELDAATVAAIAQHTTPKTPHVII